MVLGDVGTWRVHKTRRKRVDCTTGRELVIDCLNIHLACHFNNVRQNDEGDRHRAEHCRQNKSAAALYKRRVRGVEVDDRSVVRAKERGG